MKKSLFILVLAAIMGTLAAQETGDTVKKTRKGIVYLDISAGYSLPFGKYSDTDSISSGSGYAMGGFNGMISATWIGKHSFGLSAGYCYQRSALNPDAQHVTPDGQDHELGTKPWNNHYLLAGPAFVKDFGKVFVEAQLQAGIVLAFSSNFYITIPDVSDTINNTQILSKGNGFGIAMHALAGVGYRISGKVSLNLRVSYLGAIPSRKKDYYYTGSYTDEFGEIHYYTEVGEFEVKKRISTFNVGVGVTIKI